MNSLLSEVEGVSAKGPRAWSRPAAGRHAWAPALDLFVVVVCVPAIVAVLLNVALLLLTGRGGESRDFVTYWAAAHQLGEHHNPYDPDAIRHLELSAGMNAKYAAGMMRNPPSAFALVLPLGFLGIRWGSLFWSAAQLGAIALSTFLVWRMSGSPKRLFRFFGYSFGPAVACVIVGQSSVFVLLGLVLFLYWHRHSPFLAGMSLWLCMLKPHLLLPFAAVLLIWIASTRSYRIILGVATAVGLSSAIALLLDSSAWTQYRQMMTTTGIENEFIPCLGVAMRLAVHPTAEFLQFVPAALGVTWSIWYFHKRRREWDWLSDVSPLLFVSILVAPYAWFTDQAILLPAILLTAFSTRSRAALMALALGSAAIQFEVIMGLSFHSAAHILDAPAWLAWYLWARTQTCTAKTCAVLPFVQEPA